MSAKPRNKTKTALTLLSRLPRHPPELSLMLSDLGDPTSAEIAAALGVDRSTVSGWIRRGAAPRPAMLALYFVTRWGQSDVHCQAHNDAQLMATVVAVLRAQLASANAQLARLGQIGDFGTANDPAPGVATHRADPLRGIAEVLSLAAIDAPATPLPPSARQKRAELAATRLARKASGPPKPFDFLRFG